MPIMQALRVAAKTSLRFVLPRGKAEKTERRFIMPEFNPSLKRADKWLTCTEMRENDEV
jgi:hypothetical protein